MINFKQLRERTGKSSSGYDLYHKTFSGAMQHAYAFAKKKGYTVDNDDIDNKVATGPRKPSSGKTNSYILKTDKKNRHVHIQVANLDNKRYELNMYIESVTQENVELEERFTPKEIKMAIGIASDKRYAGGNYSGAVRAIEKIKRGLSNHKQVAAVLKRQNESLDENRNLFKDYEQLKKKGKSDSQAQDILLSMPQYKRYDSAKLGKLIGDALRKGTIRRKAPFKMAEEFKPHKMYDPKTGKEYDAKTQADHERMAKMGYTHEKPEVKESSELNEGLQMPRSQFDMLKKGDKLVIHFDSSIKKGHKVPMVIKSLSRSAKYNVDKINLVPQSGRGKYTLYSRQGKDATLAMGDMATVMTRIEYPKGGVQKEDINEDYAKDLDLAQKNMARLAKQEKGQEKKDYMAVARALNQGNLGAVKKVIRGISTDEIKADILNVLVGYNDLIAKMYPKAVDAKGRLKTPMSVGKMIKEDAEELDENYRELARKGMGTEPKGVRVGLELDFYEPKLGDKRFGVVTKVTNKGYMVKSLDRQDKGKIYSFAFHDRAKAKKLLSANHKPGCTSESVDEGVGEVLLALNFAMFGAVALTFITAVGMELGVIKGSDSELKTAKNDIARLKRKVQKNKQYKLDSIDKEKLNNALKIVRNAKPTAFQKLKTKLKDLVKKNEAVSPAQQAAIAIAKKEKGEKPKTENRAKADALRHMGGRRGKDSADIDIKATDDDRKAADKNIIVQLRRVADLPKGGQIEFKNGKKVNLKQNLAKAVLQKYAQLKRADDKLKFQNMAGQSPQHLQKALKLR